MPFEPSLIRIERFQADVVYHAAYNFWNLRGVLAERWAHGPVFGATAETLGQITLTPASQDGDDQRLQAVYGIRSSGLNAEGTKWVPTAREIASDWIGDVLEVLKPKRIVRTSVSLFGLYPLSDGIQASRRLRSKYYRHDQLDHVLPKSLQHDRDRYHSAIDFFVPSGKSGTGTSVVVGTVGPPHSQAGFFLHPDPERDSRWWMGIRYDRRHIDDAGIENPLQDLTSIVNLGVADYDHIFPTVLREVVS